MPTLCAAPNGTPARNSAPTTAMATATAPWTLASGPSTSPLIDHVLAETRSRGLELAGKDGFLNEMLKAVLERGMGAELTEHLGREAHARGGDGNHRNGTSRKTVATEVGPVELDQPRDRQGSFASQLVPKGARRLGGLEDQIIELNSTPPTCQLKTHRRVERAGQRAFLTRQNRDTVLG